MTIPASGRIASNCMAWLMGLLVLVAVADARGGDVLLLEVIQQDATGENAVQRPTRGATMEQVTQRFGEPQRRGDAVGDPPIARWDYEGFVVYFEHDRVLHTVPQRDERRRPAVAD